MKRYAKLLSMMLAVMLVITALGGCSSSQKSQPEEKKEQTQAQTQTQKPAGDPNKDWEKDTTPFEFEWYVNMGYSAANVSPDSLVYKTIREKTGAKWTWKVPANTGAANDMLNPMIASNSLPDVISFQASDPQIKSVRDAGMLLSYSKLSKDYAPNFFKYVPKAMVDWYSEKGEFHFLASHFSAPELFTGDNFFDAQPTAVARKDIMDKLGIKPEDFSTQEGTIAALKKVRDANYVYKDKKVIPVYFSREGGHDYTLRQTLPQFFGIPQEDKNGNFLDVRYNTELFPEVVKFANALYREKFMSDDNFTATDAQLKEKVQIGSIFMYIGNKGDLASANGKLRASDENAYMVPVGPILSRTGAKPALEVSSTGWLLTCISKNSKKPDRIVRFIEYMSSPEGKDLNAYGVEGITFKKEGANSKRVKWIEDSEYLKERKEDFNKARQKWGIASLWMFDDPVFIQQTEPLPPATLQDKMQRDITLHFSKYGFDAMPFANLRAPGGSDEAAIEQQVTDYWKITFPKIVTAESEAKALEAYNNALKHSKEVLKADKLFKVQDETFKKQKEKLGLKFGHPMYKK